MNTAPATPPRLIALSRLLLSLAVVLLLGAMLTQSVDVAKAKGSIGSRVRNQREMCAVEGGTFGSHKTALGSTVTSCSGGSEGDWSCVNATKSTHCDGIPRTAPPQSPLNGIVAPPPGNISDGPTGGNGGAPVGLASADGKHPRHRGEHQRHGHGG